MEVASNTCVRIESVHFRSARLLCFGDVLPEHYATWGILTVRGRHIITCLQDGKSFNSHLEK